MLSDVKNSLYPNLKEHTMDKHKIKTVRTNDEGGKFTYTNEKGLITFKHEWIETDEQEDEIMKDQTIKQLLAELEIHLNNNQNAKANQQMEGRNERERKIGTLKSEIVRRAGEEDED